MDEQDVGQTIIENESEPTAFAMIPKMAIMDLDPYELALYCNYKITAQEHGKCWKSNKTLAIECRMSIRQVQQTRASLEKKGYILATVKKDAKGNVNAPPNVAIKNVWAENRIRYGKVSDPMHDMHPPLQDVHTPHAPDAPKVYILEVKGEGNAAKAATPPKVLQPKKLPQNVKRWSAEQVATYWKEFETGLSALVEAWGYDRQFVGDMTAAERQTYIAAHRALSEARFECENYKSLVVYARNKSWKSAKGKGGMPIIDLAGFVMDWRNARLANHGSDPSAKPTSAANRLIVLEDTPEPPPLTEEQKAEVKAGLAQARALMGAT